MNSITFNPRIKRFTSHRRRSLAASRWNHWIITFKIPLFWLKNIVIIGLTLSLAGNFLLWLLDPHTLPMTAVQIEGTLINTDRNDLQALVSQVAQGGFFSVNLAAIRRVLLSVPWLEDVHVYRRWPDTLSIQVQEREAVAYWYGKAIVDATGHLFVVPPHWTEHQTIKNKEGMSLPRLTGPPGSIKPLLTRYYKLQQQIQSTDLRIKELGCNSRQACYMVLNKGIWLKLGRGEYDQRLQRFLTVYQRVNHPMTAFCAMPTNFSFLCQPQSEDNSITYVDLRYTNGIAVQKRLAE